MSSKISHTNKLKSSQFTRTSSGLSVRLPTTEDDLVINTTETHHPPRIKRPMTTKASSRGVSCSSQADKLAYIDVKGPLLSIKGLNLTPLTTSAEKSSIPLSVYQFRNFLPLKTDNDNLCLPSESVRRKPKGSMSHRTLKEPEGPPVDPFLYEAEILENLLHTKERGYQTLHANGFGILHKESASELSTPTYQKFRFVYAEKTDEMPFQLAKSADPDSLKGYLLRTKSPPATLTSPRIRSRKFVHLHPKVKQTVSGIKVKTNEEQLSSSLIHKTEEDEPEFKASEPKEFKGIKDRPLSQAMYRMKEFRRVKDVILKRKTGINILTENGSIYFFLNWF